jgi:hypothetical protein
VTGSDTRNHPRNRAFTEARAREAGHEYEVVCHWMIEDDADFSATCSCGWIGNHRCASGAHGLGKAHLKAVLRG